MNEFGLVVGLGLVFLAVLLLPFLVKKVEHNLEVFLFAMGIIATTIAGTWSLHLVEEALVEPIKITAAVLVAGMLFHWFRHQIRVGIAGIMGRLALPAFVFLVIVLLGLLASLISAIIAALVLVEVISASSMHRKPAVRFAVMGCFAIGLGAVLTPLGEPLSTIAIAKLQGEPYHADFLYLARLLGKFIIPAILAIGVAAVVLVGRQKEAAHELEAPEMPEKLSHVFVRAGKVYLFVMALLFLGGGFRPLIDIYIVSIPAEVLYVVNLSSAILDNATLTAAEIGPALTEMQIETALMGLLIAGGALIPGNIPNIISAGKLRIGSREWAVIGVPVALITLAVFFPILFVFGR